MEGKTICAVNFSVEGLVDEEVVLKLFRETDVTPGHQYVCQGIDQLRQKLEGFNAGAHHIPWFVLCDLDRNECPPALRSGLLKKPQAQGLQFQVAVRAIEAWLMADRKTFADFLGVNTGRVPAEPERLPEPKNTVLKLALKSGKKDLRRYFVSRRIRTGKLCEGPIYTEEVIRFVQRRWSVKRARAAAPSLERAYARCLTFSRQGSWK